MATSSQTISPQNKLWGKRWTEKGERYLRWGWRSISTQAPRPGSEPRTGSRTPRGTERSGRRWPRLDSAEPPRPDTAPRRRTAARSAWRAGTRKPRSRTSSCRDKGSRGSVVWARWRSVRPCSACSHRSLQLPTLHHPAEKVQVLPVTGNFQNKILFTFEMNVITYFCVQNIL